MKQHFTMMATYNRWANAKLYDMASQLPDEQYRKSVGVYFKSLHGTLNHILTADLIWMRRLEGTGDHPTKFDAIIHDDLTSLRERRVSEDKRLQHFVDQLLTEDFAKPWTYRMLSGASRQQPLCEILAHLFNHQTHHRGQAHAALTLLGVGEPEPLDLLMMQHGLSAVSAHGADLRL